MNAQQLAALGAMIRESIEQHVTTAVSALSEEFGKQIEAVSAKVDSVAKSIPAPYDDTNLRAEFVKMIPAAYDDGWLRKTLDAVEDQLDKLKNVEPAQPYNDTELRQMIEGVAKSVPDAYDDSKLREDLAAMLKKQDEHINAVQKMVADRPTPQNGIDGRDALHLEVLPAIDETKSYARGTYAKHAGGLWRSFEQTSGMRGWECIVDGIAVVIPEMVGKTLKLKVLHSSGMETDLSAHIPVQTYKGVFADGEYEQGDTATWAGSLWHCNVTGTKAKPGDGSADWTLAVKKGRDGREVVKTERNQKPVQINNGENNDSI